MINIGIMEAQQLNILKQNIHECLSVQKYWVEQHFDWIKIKISNKKLLGEGTLVVDRQKFKVLMLYSPEYGVKMDKIWILNQNIEFNDDIHVYSDLTLCLYHPIFDKRAFTFIPLWKILSWVSEWCHQYIQWKKYGVWMGKEVSHQKINVLDFK